MKTLTKIAAIVCAVGFVSAPAFAGPDVTQKSAVIDISAYDLSSVDGATAVHKKLQRAAKRVCNVNPGIKSVRERSQQKACEAVAIDRAVQSIRSKQLARVHEASGNS